MVVLYLPVEESAACLEQWVSWWALMLQILACGCFFKILLSVHFRRCPEVSLVKYFLSSPVTLLPPCLSTPQAPPRDQHEGMTRDLSLLWGESQSGSGILWTFLWEQLWSSGSSVARCSVTCGRPSPGLRKQNPQCRKELRRAVSGLVFSFLSVMSISFSFLDSFEQKVWILY